jgi:molecular chaperone GrpE
MQDAPELTDRKEPSLREEPAATAAPAAGQDIREGEPAAEAQPAVVAGPNLEEMLKKAELEARENHDAFLRAKAETDNVRKRAQTEIANAHKFAVETFAAELLGVKDSLEAALATDTAAVEGLKSGVELTLKQLNSVFDKFSLAEINPAGQKFDPHRHQAISMVESDAEPNTVVQVLQKGYLLHERVIRPALVTVARQKTVES